MATVILDTGILDIPTDVGTAEGTTTTTAVERQVFPSTNNEQALISVQPGYMVVVTAYGGSQLNLANVHKVLLAEPITNKVINPCGLEPIKVETVVLGEAKICSLSMVECDPVRVLDIPGVYRIGILDQDIIVTAVAHPLQK